MKKIFTILLICFAVIVNAQTPQAFKYQSVVRDVSGNVIPNQNVGFQIAILQTSATGTSVYTETHNVTTNSYGLTNLNIGNGTVVNGNFSAINWAVDIYFIQIEIDVTGGTNYQLMGVSQLLSVPYALNAKSAENVFSGDYNNLTNAPTNVSAFTNDAGYITSFNEIDGDTTNELQTITKTGLNVTLNNGGGTITDSILTETTVDNMTANNGYLTSFTEIDGDTTNELQALSISNDTVYLSNGGFVKLPQDQVNDADADSTNELQTLSLANDTLFLSGGGAIPTNNLKTKKFTQFDITGYVPGTIMGTNYITNTRLSPSTDESNYSNNILPNNIDNARIMKSGFVVPSNGIVTSLSGWFQLTTVFLTEDVEFHLFKVTPIDQSSSVSGSYSAVEIGNGITINVSQTNIEIYKMQENYTLNNSVNEGDVLIFTIKRISDNCSCNPLFQWSGNITLEVN